MTSIPFKPKGIDERLPQAPVPREISKATMWAENPKDPRTYFLGLDFFTTVSVYSLLSGAPTDSLYLMRDLIDKLLAERPDAKR